MRESGTPGSESGGRKRAHGCPTGYAPPLDSTRIWSVPFVAVPTAAPRRQPRARSLRPPGSTCGSAHRAPLQSGRRQVGSGAQRDHASRLRVGGGLQGCPLRGVRPRRWLCGCRARTARGSRRRRFYARASRPASRLVHPTRAHGRDEPDASLVVDHAVRPSRLRSSTASRTARRARRASPCSRCRCRSRAAIGVRFTGGPFSDLVGTRRRATAAPRRGRGQVDRGDGGGEIDPPPRPRKRPRLPSAAWHRILTGGSRARVFQPGEYPAQWRGISGALPGSVCGRGQDRVSLAPA